jgi:hypothetical protein
MSVGVDLAQCASQAETRQRQFVIQAGQCRRNPSFVDAAQDMHLDPLLLDNEHGFAMGMSLEKPDLGLDLTLTRPHQTAVIRARYHLCQEVGATDEAAIWLRFIVDHSHIRFGPVV